MEYNVKFVLNTTIDLITTKSVKERHIFYNYFWKKILVFSGEKLKDKITDKKFCR
jgi:hypothetical protein